MGDVLADPRSAPTGAARAQLGSAHAREVIGIPNEEDKDSSRCQAAMADKQVCEGERVVGETIEQIERLALEVGNSAEAVDRLKRLPKK